ncbi:MAG: hypothetical protein PVG07_16200 [Acidobacteriota bacterium]|jgi:hypothetical protein
MLLSPAVLALLVCSALACAVAAVAAGASLSVVAGWNPDDASARQLSRERRAFLVETTVAVVLVWQLLSVALFVATVEQLHPLFTGAMCAAGTLHASPFGYPTLSIKLAVFALCGLWLVAHHAAPAAASTGLVRARHLALPVLAGALAAENAVQLRYFADLDPAIITSCCATVFDEAAGGVGAGLASLPVPETRAVFFAGLAATLGAGWHAVRRRRSPVLFSVLSVLLGGISVAAVVAWVAPGFYELPTHHCPFCLLSAEYFYVGFLLYLFLAVAVVAGAGSGLVHALRALDPLGSIAPAEERRLCFASMAGFALFALLAVWPMAVMTLRTFRFSRIGCS